MFNLDNKELLELKTKELSITNEKELENLIVTNERDAIFYLLNCYSKDTDFELLSIDFRFNAIICVFISLLCLSLGSKEVSAYFSRYCDITETTEQAIQIFKDLNRK